MGSNIILRAPAPEDPVRTPPQTTNCPRYAEAEELNGGCPIGAAREKISGNLPLYTTVVHLFSRKTNPRTTAEGRIGPRAGRAGRAAQWWDPPHAAPEICLGKAARETNKLSLDAAPDFGCMCLPAKAWAGQKRLPETGFHVPSHKEKPLLGRSDTLGGKLKLTCLPHY